MLKTPISLATVIALLLLSPVCLAAASKSETEKVILAVHGGYAPDKPVDPKIMKDLCHGLRLALMAGYEKLKGPSKSSSLDAVEAAVKVMENSGTFNAGRGCVFTHEGKAELDASIMEGKSKMAGAVANVTTIKNPVAAARAVMEHTKHVMLVGQGADQFAKEQGLETKPPDYFFTQRRWDQLQEDLKKEKKEKEEEEARKKGGASLWVPREHKLGTVGAVALDSTGTLAAATSTGGLSNKKHGRVGDSPIIGAGTYADNEGVAVSATGEGEWFIRFHVASEINDLVKYKGLSLKQATDHVLKHELSAKAGEGGVVAIDKNGNFSAEENSEGMVRGYVTDSGAFHVLIYGEECPKEAAPADRAKHLPAH